VVDLQETLLIDLDRFWAGPQGPQPLPRNWRSHPATQACRRGLRELLLQESLRQSGPWAIKDPRSSLLLPLWRELCYELAIPLQLVLAVRSPEAVVASVMARDERLAGMTWWRAQQLWWHFNAAVLGEPRPPGEASPVVLHYEAWFSDPESQARALAAALSLPNPEPGQLAAVRAAIRPEHRHQQPLPAGAPPLDRRLQRLHRWLQHHPRLSRSLRLQQRPLRPRRPWRQEIAHRLDWIWLLGTPLLPPQGLLAYRRRFLQGEGAGPLVSLAWLGRQRPQLVTRFRDPLAWYRRCGWRQGVSPHPLLEPRRLWQQLGREREAVALYCREACRDDIAVHPRFDPVHYGRQCCDADCAPRPTPLEHYLVKGWRQGLAPHPAVDPLWMAWRHGLPGEPLTALLLAGGDATDPGLTRPRGTLYGAASADPRCIGRLPPALVALLQLWHARRLWPAERWLEPSAWQQPLPSFALGAVPKAAPLAAGLQPQSDPLLLPAPPVPVSTVSWRLRHLLAACPSATAERAVVARLHSFEHPEAALPEPTAVSPADWGLSLSWPPPQRLAEWLQALRPCCVVLDPDPERAAFLQLFGVSACHQPLAPLTIAPDERDTLLLQAQRRLGLPDPRWFDPAPALAVLGSSGQQQERRWGGLGLSPAAADLLLLPRLPQLVLDRLQDAQALQAWLEILQACGAQLLLLQPLADGACRPAPGVAVLGPEAEPELLRRWEERCR